MSALKLFISHSSRLDDVKHKYTSKDRNWNLLNNTVKAIRKSYGDRLDILVDKDGLIPGDKWEHKLNLWLAECHVAIILFSERAVEKSDWVKKEAAILSWRAELDPNFLLIPVLLDGETTPENLAEDFFGTLKIDANQCVRGAKTAASIVAALAKTLKPQSLPSPYPTPLEIIRTSIAEMLGGTVSEAALQAASLALSCDVDPDGRVNRNRYSEALARKFFETPLEDTTACFPTFQQGVAPLTHSLANRQAYGLYRHIRSLWVDPRAASCLPLVLQHKSLLGLAGNFATKNCDVLKCKSYTIERHVERAWLGLTPLVRVPMKDVDDVAEARVEIRRCIFGGDAQQPDDEAFLDRLINTKEPRIIILEANAIPGSRAIQEYKRLIADYKRLIVIFAISPVDMTAQLPLSSDIKQVEPSLNPDQEKVAYWLERAAYSFLNEQYRNTP